MGHRRSRKKALVSIFRLFNLVPKYVWFPLLISSINCNIRAKTRSGNASSLQIRERKQHDNTTKIIDYLKTFILLHCRQDKTETFLSLFFSVPTISCFFLLPLLLGLAAAKSLQLCPTLCNPVDSCPPGFPIPGIL